MPIGWEGKTLKQMLEQSERVYQETGYAHGLKELTLMEEDPLKFDRFRWRIIALLTNAREVVRYACASPGTKELGELILLYLSPEGDALAHSAGGLISHLQMDAHMVRYLCREDWETDPGINDGDIFVDNDPAPTQGAHTSDVRMCMPVFWESP